MIDSNYGEPVSKLLTLGDCRGMREWPDYLALGLGPEQIPDLIRMLHDDDFVYADSDSQKVWVPIHAWRALGQLRAEEAVDPLLDCLWRIDEFGDDWVSEEIPDVLGMIGPVAVPDLADFLLAPVEGLWARIAAASALSKIGQGHPEARDDCIVALAGGLEPFASQDPILNGFVIHYLVKLEAVEAAPLMEEAFDTDRVDLSILGDWEDAQIELGLLDARLTPPPEIFWMRDPPIYEPGPPSQAPSKEQQKQAQHAERRQQKKRKTKRKQQKKARRKQRKRK